MAAIDELPGELHALLPAALQERCELLVFDRGSRLFEAGRRPSFMHFVDDGEVALHRLGEDGEVVVLQRAQHGFVGEASLEAERYHCDAVVLATARVARMPRQALQQALKSDTAFAMRWIAMLNREMRRLRQQCERLSLNTVQARLLHIMRTEGGAAGLPLGAGLKSLAREIGVSHEALYRCVAALERRGIVTRTGSPAHLQLVPAPLRRIPT